MVVEGKMMEACEKYYHEEVIRQENNTEPRIGKLANQQFELEFLSMPCSWMECR
ncbi:hypothetical protein [Adhaeribacter pallidiroseus]|uniref:Uncharacterized protein n=1 Tax=Adhaeribacter pallidiroseus TaxID=2072847 RepID=A0A369QRE1_9BACT|nr:hypothetical protein [Adhaeribacter pallidiroseus]RDC66235.1 hypothetical protein AHMF7616_04866 [Adhaeribacter pallidiroseus]